MTLRQSANTFRSLLPAAALLLATHALMAQVPAPAAPSKPLQTHPVPTAAPVAGEPDHAAAYYHDGLAHLYEEMAVNNGRPDYASQAVEEYKLALGADPTSKYLQDGLADLYFKLGRIREAVNSAQDQVKKDPSDIAAHTLLGKVYLRSLGDMQGPQATEMLQLAIGEYEKLTQLEPKDVETHLLLGQLYGLNHDTSKAEAQFKLAQGLDSNSEEAVLNMARLYSEQGEPQQAVDALSAIPSDDRTARINFALGTAYDQLKEFKKAAVAYRAALDDEPDNPDTQKALATALLADNQLGPALEIYRQISQADAADAQSMMKISEIQRRQGHYEEALATLNKAKTLNGSNENLELSFNEAVLYDSLGKYDQAVITLQAVLNATDKLDHKYSDPEKSNRAIFLDRLGVVYQEENKTPEAINAYKQMGALGGDFVLQGYQGQIDTYRMAHQWKDAANVAADVAKAYPNNTRVQLMYAQQLADTGQAEQAIASMNAQLDRINGKGGPEERDAQLSAANIDFRLHRTSDAMEHLAKAEALAKTPDERINVDLLRATILDRDKQFEAAEAEYKKALALDPNNSNTLNDYGYMLADHGVRLPDALKMIQKSVDLDPQNGANLDSLGWVYFKMGQYGPAEENLKKAIDRTPTDASIHDHLGEIYEKTGRLKLAVAQWERSMTEYAHSLPADADPTDVAKVKRKLSDARIKLARNGVPVQK